LNYNVATAASGEDAIAYLEDHPCDLIVMDMIMDPGMDGLDTYRRIIARHPGQKAIIASGFSETKRVREAQELGAGVYVKKPYLLEKIGVAVRQELSRNKTGVGKPDQSS
jgi:DNA-binding NarL/FixJ family response regulator